MKKYCNQNISGSRAALFVLQWTLYLFTANNIMFFLLFLLSLLLLLLLRHHHHHLPLHHHLVLHRARHGDEGERHLDLANLGLGQHLLSDVERRGEADLLVQEDAAAARHPGPEHGRDQTVDEDAVDDGRLEGGGAGVDGVQVDRVVVTRQLGEQLHISGRERFGEGGFLADVEQTT